MGGFGPQRWVFDDSVVYSPAGFLLFRPRSGVCPYNKERSKRRRASTAKIGRNTHDKALYKCHVLIFIFIIIVAVRSLLTRNGKQRLEGRLYRQYV